MATPIRETPVLAGRDVARLQKNIEANAKRDHSASYARAKAVFAAFQGNTNGVKLRASANAAQFIA
jgi:hypothetical protein